MSDRDEKYAICIVGGAAAGAEAAGIFADRGILTVVLEQNDRPYGKIEDGLPRWHVELRRKEYATIDSKLTKPHVHLVPRTKLGRDVGLRQLVDEWCFHSVVLANGAWQDRPLPIEGADAYVGKGLIYQNPFIYWFNHYTEASYAGEQYEILDGTAIVGGGLGSIDVAKAIQLELCVRGLRERGIEQDLVELEVHGLPATLESHGLTWDDLGYDGCTLYYRRRPEDMPLVELPDGANDKVGERVRKTRARILEKAVSKYLFKLQPLLAPTGLIVEGDRLAGLEFGRTSMDSGRLELTDERVRVRAPQVISSIGSIPEKIPDVSTKGDLYAFEDWDLGRLPGYPTLFSVGNVVTGKGNIVASRKHSRHVSTHVTDEYVGLANDIGKLEPLTAEQRETLLERVRELQERVGFDGDYAAWIEAVTPPDLV